MKKITFLILTFYSSFSVFSQTIALSDNMPIASNTSYTITPGTYAIADAGNPGIINITNKSNVVIDAAGVSTTGTGFTGYVVYINNCDNITIKNFQSGSNYKYAVYAENSRRITVNGCSFSDNKKETTGWLNIGADKNSANGGGIFMYNCNNSDVFSNTMINQNDGVALYDCDTIRIHDNNLSHNTAYGVRMFHANYCTINNNDCSYANRTTDPSDCAAILLFFSKENEITYNDCTYGGDGLFTNSNITWDGGINTIPNFVDNNYFAYNDCSYSPHNAIESVFTNGNIFKHNTASHSGYGIWAGYAQSTVIDSNLIEYNGSGIDIEMGRNNSISNNAINNNSFGVHLRYDYYPSAPYNNWDSKNNLIDNNSFNYNSTGISLSNTSNTKIKDNLIRRSVYGIVFESGTLTPNLSVNDTIVNDSLKSCSSFNIQNLSPNTIQATNNYYGTNDTSLIKCKIYDVEDDAAKGKVFWNPYLSASGSSLPDSIPPDDLAEEEYSDWTVTTDDGAATSWFYDATDKLARFNSLHITTASGFAVKAFYYPSTDKDIAWDLTSYDTMYISVKSINVNSFQQNYIELGDGCGNYYRYQPDPGNFLNPATANGGTWKSYAIPLAGNSTWFRTSSATPPSMSGISYIYVMADTWDYGFQLWIDGLGFTGNGFTLSTKEKNNKLTTLETYPNPFNANTTISYTISNSANMELSLIDLLGNKIAIIDSGNKISGAYKTEWNAQNMPSGIYLLQLKVDTLVVTKKLIIAK